MRTLLIVVIILFCTPVFANTDGNQTCVSYQLLHEDIETVECFPLKIKMGNLKKVGFEKRGHRCYVKKTFESQGKFVSTERDSYSEIKCDSIKDGSGGSLHPVPAHLLKSKVSFGKKITSKNTCIIYIHWLKRTKKEYSYACLGQSPYYYSFQIKKEGGKCYLLLAQSFETVITDSGGKKEKSQGKALIERRIVCGSESVTNRDVVYKRFKSK